MTRDDAMTRSDGHTSVDVTEELEESFFAYSSSVLTSRALPDVRDGLTPVRRRILYAMLRAGTLSSKSYKKSVASVSDTMKSYHPHGDASIYGSLAKMAQPFSMNVVLVDGHGNFGAPDHPPAAPRYTEARLSVPAEMMLEGIDEECVDFVPNFDSSTHEPVVLPAAWPALLVNGSQGVAVGVTTSIPPHNPKEVLEAALYRLANPRCRLRSVMRKLPGPDYPTSARIMADRSSLVDLYSSGVGAVVLRSSVTVSVSGESLQQVLDFSDVPYSSSPEKVVVAVNKASADGGPLEALVESIEDLSDRLHGLLLRVTLRPGVTAADALEPLYRCSPLEVTEHYRMAVLDGEGRLQAESGLLYLLDAYLDHRVEVVRRRSVFRLDRARERLERTEALLKAHSMMDQVIELCRGPMTKSKLVDALSKLLGVAREHATAVADLPLRSIGRLDSKELGRRAASLRKDIDSLELLLSDESKRKAAVAKDLRSALAEFEGHDRRTEISDTDDESVLAPEEAASRSFDACVLSDGRVSSFVPDGQEAVSASHASPQGAVCVAFSDGTAVRMDCAVLRASTTPLYLGKEAISVVPDASRVLLATAGLKAKHVDLATAVPKYYMSGQPTSLVSLGPEDSLVSVVVSPEGDGSALVSAVASDGAVLVIESGSIPQQGLSAAGVVMMAARGNRRLLAAGTAPSVTVALSGRRAAVCTVPVADLPVASRGTVGRRPSVKDWPTEPFAAYCGTHKSKWMARRKAFCLRGL